jgi:hypothetical protein
MEGGDCSAACVLSRPRLGFAHHIVHFGEQLICPIRLTDEAAVTGNVSLSGLCSPGSDDQEDSGPTSVNLLRRVHPVARAGHLNVVKSNRTSRVSSSFSAASAFSASTTSKPFSSNRPTAYRRTSASSSTTRITGFWGPIRREPPTRFNVPPTHRRGEPKGINTRLIDRSAL